jgi:protein-disulfide isomerase
MLPGPTRLAFLALAALALSAPLARAEMNEDQKREVERIVRDYILTNPEIVETALMALEEKRREEAKAKQAETIAGMKERIFNSPHQVVLGNPVGRVTLVEFFDYNCGYCKRAFGDMMALIEANPDLRVVLKEFPILSEGSLEAARLAVALNRLAPGKYLDFHREMLTRGGPANAEKALGIARELGLDADALQAEAAKEDVMQGLAEVQELARALDVSGTPSYVVGNEAVFGAVGFETLQEKIKAAREEG